MKRAAVCCVVATVWLSFACGPAPQTGPKDVSPADADWSLRVQKEKRIRSRFPAGRYLGAFGEGETYDAAVLNGKGKVAGQIRQVVQSRVEQVRQFYASNGAEHYVETFDERISVTSNFRYSADIKDRKEDSFRYGAGFVAWVYLDKVETARRYEGRFEQNRLRVEELHRSITEAAMHRDGKRYNGLIRELNDVVARMDGDAVEYFAIMRQEPKTMKDARTRVVEAEASGRELRNALRPAIVFRGTPDVSSVKETVISRLDAALTALGLQPTVGECGEENIMEVVLDVGRNCSLSAGAGVKCQVEMDVSVGLCGRDTVLTTFKLRGKMARSPYSQDEAASKSANSLTKEHLLPQLRSALGPLVPLLM